MIRLAFLAVAALAGSAAIALPAPADEGFRTLEVEIRDGERLVASHVVQVRLGRSSAVAAGDYALRLRMERAPGGDAAGAPFMLRSNLYSSQSGWALVATPAMAVSQGEEVRQRIDARDGSDLSMAVLLR